MQPTLARFEGNFWEGMEAGLFSCFKLNVFLKGEVLEIFVQWSLRYSLTS
jgi:hypothetical protein